MIKRISLLFLLFFLSNSNLFSQLYFNEVSNSVGFNHTYLNGVSGAGLSFADFNGDGYDDISIPTNGDNSILFFINVEGTFNLIDLNIDFPYQAKQILWIDYDNDYDKDLYITSFEGKNKLFQNKGSLYFEDITLKVGLPDSLSNSFGSSWSDINNDGYLDLYQSYRNDSASINNAKLFLSDSANYFSDITSSSGLLELNKLPFCATFFDINNDNFQDLYIANDKMSGNSLYYNNGNSSFTNISESSNSGILMNGMSVTINDFNNDGFMDMYSTNIEDGSKMFVNNKDLTFTESANQLGVSFNGIGWGSQFEDFDLDGYEDLYVSGSLVGMDTLSSAFYSNIFGKYFTLNTSLGLNMDTVSSFGNATGDYNNDGLPDIVVLNNSPSNSFLLKNNYSGKNNWIKLKLTGLESNHDGYGSSIKLYTNDLIQYRTTHSTQGYISQNTNSIFFGFGENEIIDSLIIKWPSGVKDKIINPSINTILNVFEGSSLLPPRIFTNSQFFCGGGITLLEAGKFSSYRWSNGDTTKSISVSTPGYYYVEVTDINGNSFISDSILISSVVPPQFSLLQKNITSNYSSSIKVLGLEDNPYYVSLDGSDYIKNKFYFTNLSSGDHSISIRDSLGCKSTVEFTILNLVKETSNNDEYEKSIARKWMEVLLDAIRNDLARPPVHARNLFHLSAMMYDAFVINSKVLDSISSTPFLLNNSVNDINFMFQYSDNFSFDQNAINEIISFASYSLLKHRFKKSVNSAFTLSKIDSMMINLDYDYNYKAKDYLSGDPRSIGNYIAELYINYGKQDNSNEINNYVNTYYEPINPPLNPNLSGNQNLIDPNRWQSLLLGEFIDQSGNIIDGIPSFISPEWGNVIPFALSQDDLVIKVRDNDIYKIYHDAGEPVYIDTINQGLSDSLFKHAFSMVSVWSSHLDRKDGVIWDISPNSIGNVSNYPEEIIDYASFYKYFDGGDIGQGYSINPIINSPYEQQLVPRGDYVRVLAEFWADGPDSETPPGHWFVILNEVNDSELLVKKFEGNGEELDDLEWDIKSYFTLGGAMHDAAISAWGIKGYYDYIRPISVLRYLSDQGQSTFNDSLNYNPNGYNLIENYIEIVNLNDSLVGDNLENLGKIKLFTWKGHENGEFVNNESGSGWILAENWWPYQRPSFVTPPFAGYVSGHSTYSKAAATVLSKITGSPFFPGGIGEFDIQKDEFLVFEKGPSIDMKLQWAKYDDAADQCSLSRIWGGIHPYIDDLPGRLIGKKVGNDAFDMAKSYFLNIDIINAIEKQSYNFRVFPNPINNNTFINVINESIKEISFIELYDLKGKKIDINIIKDLNNDIKIKSSNINEGIYIMYVVFSDGSYKSTKLVVRK